jgi:hypothetical protein
MYNPCCLTVLRRLESCDTSKKFIHSKHTSEESRNLEKAMIVAKVFGIFLYPVDVTLHTSRQSHLLGLR